MSEPVRLGLQLPVQAQSRVFAERWEAGAGPDELAAVARAAEDAGIDYLAVCDHVAIPADHVEGMSATWYDPIATLGYLAAVTSRVELVTHVYVLALRHPLLAAKQLATVDRLAGGRLVVGVGAGHVEAEFDQLGVPFTERGAILDEAIDAVRLALTEETPSFHGGRFRFEQLAVSPQPVRLPPPIWVGGSSPAALRRAGVRGDGWLPQGTPLRQLPDAMATIRTAAAEAERSLAGFAWGGQAPPLRLGEPDGEPGPYDRSGTGEELALLLRRWVDIGVTHLQIRLRSRSAADLVDQLGRFGEEVRPLLA